jgi:aminoglycoside phosphotransferase family enzyme/predicted kinase
MDRQAVASLLKTTSYPERTGSVQLIQTHVSLLFMTAEYVYKVKKPVDFGFLNFSTLDRRRFYCNEEVRLNRRLCPGMYLGVVEVRESPDGASFHGSGTIIDYAVKMKRLPADRMLDRLLQRDEVSADDIRAIARTIAEFHLTAEQGDAISSYGSVESIGRNIDENFLQTAAFIPATIDRATFKLLKDWTDRFLAENGRLFEERVRTGRIRDCDGDIHLENICLSDRVWIFDCIEFNNRFRYSDTAADIAFLLMDLEYQGADRFLKPLLDEYITITEDDGIVELLDFYKVYRAMVRGKVESFRLNDPDIPEKDKTLAGERAARYFRLARRYVLRRRLAPTLFITCGLTGSGKSSVARELAFDLGIDVHSSDVIRKELAGVSPTERSEVPFRNGMYSPGVTESVYAVLLSRGETALAAGRSVILDATFLDGAKRRACREMAGMHHAQLAILQATVPEPVARDRLDRRHEAGAGASDGRWEIYLEQRKAFEPVSPDEGILIPLDTTGPAADNVRVVFARLEIMQ